MNILADTVFQIPQRQTLYLLQVILEEALFVIHFKRKDYFFLRAAVALSAYVLISLSLFLLINPFTEYNLFLVFFISIGVIFACFDNPAGDVLFACFSGITVQNLAYNTGVLFCLALNVSPDITSGWESKIVQATAFVIVNVLCYFLCVRRANRTDTVGDCRKEMIAIATVVFLIIYILEIYMAVIGMLYFGVVRFLFVICDLMVLLQLYWILEKHQTEQERKTLRSLISMQYNQFEMSKSTMEIIHMKEHDLKHLLTILRREDQIRQSDTYRELEQAVSSFAGAIKTGDSTMDVILSEKNMLCRNHKITMTYMIDPHGLEQLTEEDKAAIFGNLLDNAIRYLQGVEDPELRLLHLQVRNAAGMLLIHVENYFQSQLEFQDGLPLTTKTNREIHGYGLKSTRYLAEKYGGAMSINQEDNLFLVDISIPLKE